MKQRTTHLQSASENQANRTLMSSLAVASVLFLSVVFAFAGGTSCGNATVLVPDGRVLAFDSVPANGLAFLQIRDTSTMEPAMSHSGTRISIPSPDAETYYVKVSNRDAAASHYVSVRVADTTMFSPAWKLVEITSPTYSFMNTSNAPVNATLIFYNGATKLTPITETFQPGNTSLNTSSVSLNVTGVGAVYLTHDGRPLQFSFSPTNYNQPSPFAAVRESSH